MKIDSIDLLQKINPSPTMENNEKQISGGESFSSYLGRSINEVNDLLKTSDTLTNDLATGKVENLHDAMIGFEKAETAFKLLVQVRNKALEAYHEVLRMQV